MTLKDLTLRLRALIAPRRVERELDDELSFHIEREAHKHIANGIPPAEARRRARAKFGSVALAADECRDARGTHFIDTCVRDITYALRTFRRTPLVALTIVTTVALGLGLVAVVFTFLNVFLFRVDNVPNLQEIYAVVRPESSNGETVGFTRLQLEAIRRDTRVFSSVFGMLLDIDSRIDGRMMGGTLVTGNFFQALDVKPALGRTLTPDDDQRSAPRPVIVLSHRGWTRHFAKDPAVLGRRVTVNGFPFEIVGVMPDGFRGLSVGTPDYWAPLSLLGQFRLVHAGREDAVAIGIIGRLKPEISRQRALAELIAWDSGSATDPRSARLSLEPRRGTIPHPGEALILFTPLFFAFGLILMIGCANVANLLLGRAVSRQREIGIRLSLGASRGRLIRQLLTESLLLALAAAVLGFILSRLAIDGTVFAVMSTVAPELAENFTLSAPAGDWRVILFLVVGAMASTVFFGLAPALQATRIDLMRTIRGDLIGPRPSRARHLLIGLQVTASALLLVCSAIFLRSAIAASKFDPGIRTSDTIFIDIPNEQTRGALLQAIRADASVVAVAAASPGPLGSPRLASAETAGRKTSVVYKFASPEYFGVMGIDIIRGRGFSEAERTPNTGVIVIAESLARELWPNADPVGQELRLDTDPASVSSDPNDPALTLRAFTVVGVARDVAGFRLAEFEEANIYVPINTSIANTKLTVRVHGEPETVRQALLPKLTAIDPNMGVVATMATIASMQTYILKVAFWLTLVLGALALALTVSGLFSVLSYLVEQRAKEIGVRVALGATKRAVGELVLWQLTRPVCVGLLIGGGFAALLGIALMATPAADRIGEIVHVFDPIAYAGSLLLIVGACTAAALVPAMRAARIDPVVTLRQD